MLSTQGMLTKGRLTKSIYPTHYILHVEPNFDTIGSDDVINATFNGHVDIKVVFDNNYTTLPKFALHAKELNILSVTLNATNVDNFELDSEHELLIITPAKQTLNNLSQHTLSVRYSGTLNDDLKGFYRSKYTDSNNGREMWMVTTQFESTDARRAFPCFDEPNFKAIYDISVTHPIDKIALSNGSVKERVQHGNGKQTTVFNTTPDSTILGDNPKMSTYLVAFIVGSFESIEGWSSTQIGKVGRPKKVTIYGTPGNKDKMTFALDVAIRSLEWYERWFQIEYPLDKMDLIGVPDFNAGAMENWGLITFRPEYIFCDESTELASKVDVVVTIAHEIAHQWFGNLVTMEWWNYLWLNESMATYFGWLVCHELFPTWNVWNKFIDSEYNYALELDSLESSHPIEFDESIVENAKDIDQIFDGISYSKGSCLVKSLAHQLGKTQLGNGVDKFREGMQIYMRKNRWGNTTSKDLWESFDEAIGKSNSNDFAKNQSVADLMASWTSQTGYPVVGVKRNGDNTEMSQRKYLKSGPNNKDTSEWLIPLVISSGSDDIHLTFGGKTKVYPLSCQTCSFVVNPDRHGFYRVMYEAQNLNDLPFKINELSTDTQKQILGDMFSLGLNGYQNLQLVFDVLNEIDLRTVTDYVLWSTVLSNLSVIFNLLKKNKEQQFAIRQFITYKILPHAKKLLLQIGIDDSDSDSVNDQDLRPDLISFLTLMDDPDIINLAKQQFHSGKYRYILSTVAKNATNEEYNKMIELLETQTEFDPQLRGDLLRAIPYVSDSALINDVINVVLTTKVREQDADTIVAHLSLNEHAADAIWKFAEENWGKIRIFEEKSSSITHTVKSIALGFCTQEELNKYKAFFELRGKPQGTDMVISQMIERIESKIKSIERILNSNIRF